MMPFLRAAAPVVLAAALSATATGAFANSSNKLVLGLGMTFGKQVQPELYTGLVHADTSASGDVTGAKALVYWSFAHSLSPSKVKVLAILGGKNWQPEIGAGYSFDQRNGLFTGGLTNKHLTGGVDFTPATGVSPYFGVQLPGKY